MESSGKIRCNQCQFYYVTWDKKFPYGCRSLGFKSPILPSNYVFQTSGTICQSFQPKNRPKE